MGVVVCGDCTEVLKGSPGSSAHLILSDIPYGIGLDEWDVLHDNTNRALLGRSPAQEGTSFKRRGKPLRGWAKSDQTIPKQYQDWCLRWARDWFRILKPGGSAIVFSGRRFAHRCAWALEEEGFVLRDMLAWEKPQATFKAQRISVVFERRGDRSSAATWDGWRVGNLAPLFEPILWFFKPYAVTITDNVLEHRVGAYNLRRFEEIFDTHGNILRCGFADGEGGLHEAQKPLRLMRGLVELATLPGQLVVDPFAGSGTTAIAALYSERDFFVVEQSSELCRSIKQRVAEAQGDIAQRAVFDQMGS
jgi:site-specific DNA-methyltransferase (adenine-specific)